MKLKEFQKSYLPKINKFLEEKLALEVKDKSFKDILSYSVLAGGKRLRPLLFLATLHTLGKEIGENEIQIAAGIELIHTYSLIHDDLPAMDNDDFRRGKLTSHKKWGHAQAILAGDALLPLGIQWIVQAGQSVEMIEVITKAIGPNGMVEGQYLDIEGTNNPEAKEDQELADKMEWLKTGCLIQASVEMAAIYGQAELKQREDLVKMSVFFGRAYQIYDDLVDVVENSNEAGKATHKDEKEGKNNTLTVLGITQSREKLQHLVDQGNNIVKKFENPILGEFFTLYEKVL
ncbi:polyprenyl synthetase family protein [Lactobacillus sp. PV012]|uniref:polyprenyl synthetase family protein n=1 Tax=Lactobacillus sp. PV012 TaxID=2594494 RepID=UPI00223F22B0|nr:polyprenyl synthetase family protein [Lactobacillus sp. PV012]QNQ82081.1 polyprenyl synthetase family protein [Lactobacillus sp. PV012]